VKLLISSSNYIFHFISTPFTFAQVPTSWKEYNNTYRCAVFFSYPSDWTLSEERTRDRFDTSDPSIVSVRSPSSNKLPWFQILECAQWPRNPSLPFELYVDQFMNEFVQGLGGEIIERTHMIPDLISNSTVDAYVFTSKASIPVYDIINGYKEHEVGIEIYWVLNNGIRYAFGYADMADRFDSPESKEMRNRILQSLKFQY